MKTFSRLNPVQYFFNLWIILFLTVFFQLSSSATISGEIFGFLDANYDRYTDLLVRRNKSMLAVYLASMEKPEFSESQPFSVVIPWSETIVNVGIADFNGDSYPDFLVTSAYNEDLKNDIYNVSICWGNGMNFNNCTRTVDEWQNIKGQPVIMNCNKDDISDFFVVIANGTTFCYLGSSTTTKFSEIVVFEKNAEKRTMFPNAAHGFVDITGDLNADVVLLVKNNYTEYKHLPSFELWERTGDQGWSLSKMEIPPPMLRPKLLDKTSEFKIGHVVFDDFNRDGRVDILLPFCIDNCADHNLTLMIGWSDNMNKWSWTAIVVQLQHDGQNLLLANSPMPFDVRSGDYTQNGFPDLLMVLDSEKVNKAFLVENIPCNNDNDCRTYGRSFQMSDWQPVSKCGKKSVKTATYFDLNEDGTMDILQECDDNTLEFSASGYTGDTTFLKVEIYTSSCASNCANGKEGSGISLPGASLNYTMVDTDGNQISSAFTQQSCTTYKSLLLPYVLFGLGRSPNFVDKLKLGIPFWPPANHTWPQIVPNSRMYAIPYPSNEPDRWIGRLYVTPSRLIYLSLAALGGVCGVLIITIVILHLYELKADKKEKELQKKNFHFDAM